MRDPTQIDTRILNGNTSLSPAVMSKPQNAVERLSATVSSVAESQAMRPQLLFTGEDAVAIVARILLTATSITVNTGFGPVELKPGTIWSGSRILVSADTVFVRYTVDDRLYEWGTTFFLRNEWFNAAGRAVAQAEFFTYIAAFEIALISGLYVPWYLLLGVSVASLSLNYHHNRETYNAALKQGPPILRLLSDLRRRSPTLFDKLATTAAKEVLVNLPSGISGEDVGFFLGRVVRGISGAPEVTLGIVLRTVLRVAVIVGAIHLPAITAEAIKNAARANAAELQSKLAEEGITLNNAEAERMLSEVLAHPDSVKKLQELEQGLGELIPLLERISEALHR
jgi:hypothetical protein